MPPPRSVITIGSFDGLHRGHQRLLAEARRLADPRGARVVAVTFTDHPATVLSPDHAPPVILHRDQRERALRQAGADAVDWLDPAGGVLQLDPAEFIEMIVEAHDPIALVEGRNFRFGRKRAGDTETLAALGAKMGFELRVLDLELVALRDKTLAPLSSSLVRWMIGEGRVADATLCLNRPWAMRGRVVPGAQRGRDLGSPTANLQTTPQMLPADGVYAGLARIDDEPGEHLAALSVGTRPTFDQDPHPRAAEVFLLDYEGDLYDKTLTVDVLRWLRDQRAFPTAEALKRQIGHDVAWTRRLADRDLLDPAALSTDPQRHTGWAP